MMTMTMVPAMMAMAIVLTPVMMEALLLHACVHACWCLPADADAVDLRWFRARPLVGEVMLLLF